MTIITATDVPLARPPRFPTRVSGTVRSTKLCRARHSVGINVHRDDTRKSCAGKVVDRAEDVAFHLRVRSARDLPLKCRVEMSS
jgi:hypothetical protein